ncbi:retrovirus-related pol polyprotein from transposon TNT 1-94 [Tanacetum coccineum]
METEVAKCSVDKKTFKIKEKELLLENDRLSKLIISQDLVYTSVNSLAEIIVYQSMEKSFLNEYSECVELKAELTKKNEMVEKAVYDELSKQCARMENIFQLEAKNNSISKLKDHIATVKGKGVSKSDKYENTSKVIALGMYKLDLEPLSPKLLKNREAHVDYLKHTHKNANTLREIVEQARALKPLDSDLDSACHDSGSKPLGNTKKNKISRPTSSNKKNKVEDHLRSVKSSLDKKNHVSKPVCNENVKHSMLNVNSELVFTTCNECMFDAIHDLCVLNYMNDVDVRVKHKSTKPKSVKSKKKKVWKPKGKVFTDVGNRWKPTGRTFIVDGNTCPLTRITSNPIVPPKETSQTHVITSNPEIKVYRRRTKIVKFVSLSSEPSILGPRPSNNKEPNRNWGSTFSNSPSTSRVHYRSSKLSSAVATACYTQNRSLICKRHNKTPYEFLHDKKPDLTYFYVFGALCYPTNDSEDLGKLKPKADIGIFVSYAPAKKAF